MPYLKILNLVKFENDYFVRTKLFTDKDEPLSKVHFRTLSLNMRANMKAEEVKEVDYDDIQKVSRIERKIFLETIRDCKIKVTTDKWRIEQFKNKVYLINKDNEIINCENDIQEILQVTTSEFININKNKLERIKDILQDDFILFQACVEQQNLKLTPVKYTKYLLIESNKQIYLKYETIDNYKIVKITYFNCYTKKEDFNIKSEKQPILTQEIYEKIKETLREYHHQLEHFKTCLIQFLLKTENNTLNIDYAKEISY